MPRYFTQYWKNDLWERHRQSSDGMCFIHTSGNKFQAMEVKPGDCVYAITVIQGRLYLAGRIEVDRLVTQKEANKVFSKAPPYNAEELYEAEDHLLAWEENGVPFDFDRPVPVKVSKRLLFVRGNRPPIPPVFKQGKLDRQTLRRLRELTLESAELLDDVIDAEE